MLGGIAQGCGEGQVDFTVGQPQCVLGILAFLWHSRLCGQLPGHAKRRLIDQATGRGQCSGCVELQRRIAGADQVFADQKRDEEQPKDAKERRNGDRRRCGGVGS